MLNMGQFVFQAGELKAIFKEIYDMAQKTFVSSTTNREQQSIGSKIASLQIDAAVIVEKVDDKLSQLIPDRKKPFGLGNHVVDIFHESLRIKSGIGSAILLDAMSQLAIAISKAQHTPNIFDNTPILPASATSPQKLLTHKVETPKTGRKSSKKGSPTLTKMRIPLPSEKAVWLSIENEYDISKVAYGRKINFIKDKHKRNIIFRDITQAYILVENGFYKPAVLLAGGVIEEILRAFIEHKYKKPTRSTFDKYINQLNNDGLLKDTAVHLSHATRINRNLVHIEKEKNANSAISKATAKNTVSSIFIIVNQFD